MRKTKIVATLGPASMKNQMISGLYAVGVSVFRLNCSHLSTEALVEAIGTVRKNAPDAAILVDIQGPKLRFNGDEIELRDNSRIDFTLAQLGIEESPRGGTRGVEAGHRILLDDGRVGCRVDEVDGPVLHCTVVQGGRVRRNKGVNLPDTTVSGGLLSDKDLADLKVARELGVEMVAISFVQHPNDVRAVRDMVGENLLVISKIERPQALDLIEEICAASDGVMAARGDLGVELPYEAVPAAQQRIALAALKAGIVSICATEMLESMITTNRPTRAEVSDVTAAVRDGFDAVMLSAETAVGHDPIGAVRAMARISESAEMHVVMPNWFADEHPEAAAVTAAASALAKRIHADSILSITFTGYSARLLAACRPSCPIVAVTPAVDAARRLRVNRGVVPVVVPRDGNITKAIQSGVDAAKDAGLVQSGDTIVVCVSRLNPRSDADTILLHQEP